ncbi:hypothetical protein F4809DRAFT_615099, partial [Biscogniauxia mediterranea]
MCVKLRTFVRLGSDFHVCLFLYYLPTYLPNLPARLDMLGFAFFTPSFLPFFFLFSFLFFPLLHITYIAWV